MHVPQTTNAIVHAVGADVALSAVINIPKLKISFKFWEFVQMYDICP